MTPLFRLTKLYASWKVSPLVFITYAMTTEAERETPAAQCTKTEAFLSPSVI